MPKTASNFTKYLFVGVIKTLLTLFLLWLAIDIYEIKNRVLTRITILFFIFIITHFIYKKIGYTK